MKAIKETILYFQSIYDEKNFECHDGNREQIGETNFVVEKMKMLKELMSNNIMSVKNNLKKEDCNFRKVCE